MNSKRFLWVICVSVASAIATLLSIIAFASEIRSQDEARGVLPRNSGVPVIVICGHGCRPCRPLRSAQLYRADDGVCEAHPLTSTRTDGHGASIEDIIENVKHLIAESEKRQEQVESEVGTFSFRQEHVFGEVSIPFDATMIRANSSEAEEMKALHDRLELWEQLNEEQRKVAAEELARTLSGILSRAVLEQMDVSYVGTHRTELAGILRVIIAVPRENPVPTEDLTPKGDTGHSGSGEMESGE